MNNTKSTIGRRSFIKSIVVAGGGMMLGFNIQATGKNNPKRIQGKSDNLYNINAYLRIGENGIVTIISPNPEAGQNVKTSMPQIVAEELDVNWKNVIVEQAYLNTKLYTGQTIGGSNAIRQGWKTLRMAGATARYMLRQAAANAWQVPMTEITTSEGMLYHKKSGKSAGYGNMASAASNIPIPKEVELKNPKEFRIVGQSLKNVDGIKMVTGKPLFGSDIKVEGMLIAMIVHPPAFGLKLKSFKDTAARAMPGIKDIFTIKVFDDEYVRQHFDTCTFPDLVAVVGNSTWEVLKAKAALEIEWEPITEHKLTRNDFYNGLETVTVPAGFENTKDHIAKMAEMTTKQGKVIRKDGDPEKAFENAVKVIERTYTAPFLAHNCMEPMNFFAHVTPEKVELAGPLQKAENTQRALAARLGIPVDKINIQIIRLGGGFGRRSYAHWLIEAALISQKMKAPIKLLYTREDDMTSGIYRPSYSITYRAALDVNNHMTAFHIKAGGIPESPLINADQFPAGAVENFLAETWSIASNITTGSFRAPRHNFMASAEQSFLDEVAEVAGKDPIEFRLELLESARTNPIGKNNRYDAGRYAGVLKLVREKSGWGKDNSSLHRGVAAYYCQGSYVAEVLDLKMENGKPVIPRVCCAIDCGIVVNPDGAANQTEGCIVDGIGVAMYGQLTFREGATNQTNLDNYQMIRNSGAPKSVDVHFVESDLDPTGVGEPPYPPVIGALANALYKATGKRFYNQPFFAE
ncbi:MAG: molybdopterin cofactor-binding domain-containing protein [Bacteroidales bacterium]